jgi:hypothetical protein
MVTTAQPHIPMAGAPPEMATQNADVVLTVGGALVNDLSVTPQRIGNKRGRDNTARKKHNCSLCHKPRTECQGFWRQSRCPLSPNYEVPHDKPKRKHTKRAPPAPAAPASTAPAPATPAPAAPAPTAPAPTAPAPATPATATPPLLRPLPLHPAVIGLAPMFDGRPCILSALLAEKEQSELNLIQLRRRLDSEWHHVGGLMDLGVRPNPIFARTTTSADTSSANL